MPCPFIGPKYFGLVQFFLCQTKNIFTYCGSHKHFVPEKNSRRLKNSFLEIDEDQLEF